jgi:hypothetical protein
MKVESSRVPWWVTINEVKDRYMALWRLAQSHDASRWKLNVMYTTTVGSAVLREGGAFHVPNRIDIYRMYYDGAKQYEPHWHRNNGVELDLFELLYEFFALAHEYGHMLSFERVRPAALDGANERFHHWVALDGPVTSADFALVVAEERLAWSLAHETLIALDWREWELFDHVRDTLLGTYESAPVLDLPWQ